MNGLRLSEPPGVRAPGTECDRPGRGFHLKALILAAWIVAGCAAPDDGDGGTPTGPTGGGSSGGGSGGGTTPNVTFATPDTYFADGGSTLQFRGYNTTQLTVSVTTDFVFRFASDYQAQAAIITPAQLNNFTSFAAFSGFGLFDNTYGTKSVTLSPGTYYLAVRNTSSGDNSWRYELDKAIRLDPDQGYSFSFSSFDLQRTYQLTAGQRSTQPFTVLAGYRYFIDGCNSGLDFFIMPAVEGPKFLNGQSFQTYTPYTGTGKAHPGLWEIRLPAGDYVIGTRNIETSSHAMVYTLERWRIN
ncbi:MAG TPA: hypothetical protein VHM24_14225 [Gemmatimonadaceae bacterium]|nr:hypothetical protein [Gemmatimonadaceae bacterium]